VCPRHDAYAHRITQSVDQPESLETMHSRCKTDSTDTIHIHDIMSTHTYVSRVFNLNSSLLHQIRYLVQVRAVIWSPAVELALLAPVLAPGNNDATQTKLVSMLVSRASCACPASGTTSFRHGYAPTHNELVSRVYQLELQLMSYVLHLYT
jgi:hypothetical protein